jgi:hypothetical protein
MCPFAPPKPAKSTSCVCLYVPKWGKSTVTEQNIESKVRMWSDTFNLSVRVVNDPGCFFALELTTPITAGHNVIVVRRLKERPRYLTFVTRISAGALQPVVDQLDKRGAERLSLDIAREMLRLNMSYFGLKPPLKYFFIAKELPISEDLNEYEFIRAFQDVNHALLATSVVVESTLLESGALKSLPPSLQ